jgi:DNA-binding PadR family transcriptional regulator
VALAAASGSGYGVRQQLESDALGELKVGNGSFYPALDRLVRLDAVERAPGSRPGAGLLRLSRTGRLMMEWELTTLRRLIRVAESRV